MTRVREATTMIVGARDAANAAGVVAVVRAERRGGGEGRAKRRHRGPEARAAGPAREEVWGSSDPRAPGRSTTENENIKTPRLRRERERAALFPFSPFLRRPFWKRRARTVESHGQPVTSFGNGHFFKTAIIQSHSPRPRGSATSPDRLSRPMPRVVGKVFSAIPRLASPSRAASTRTSTPAPSAFAR